MSNSYFFLSTFCFFNSTHGLKRFLRVSAGERLADVGSYPVRSIGPAFAIVAGCNSTGCTSSLLRDPLILSLSLSLSLSRARARALARSLARSFIRTHARARTHTHPVFHAHEHTPGQGTGRRWRRCRCLRGTLLLQGRAASGNPVQRPRTQRLSRSGPLPKTSCFRTERQE
jgi:hypothetical protein